MEREKTERKEGDGVGKEMVVVTCQMGNEMAML